MSDNHPLVTIGVTSYNNSRFVIQTLNSIASQTYKNIEILINDDCSEDNSVQLIQDWIKKNDSLEVQFFQQNINQGVCSSANRIIQSSEGKYISIIGSDDYYLPDFISKRVSLLEKSNESVGLCYSWTNIMYEDGRPMIKERRAENPSGYLFDFITKGVSSLCKPFTILTKKEVFDKVGLYDETLMYEDLDWFLRASKEYQFQFFDSYDTIYREHSGSLGTKIYSTEKGILSQLKIIEKNIGYSKVGDSNLDRRLRALIVRSHHLFPDLAIKISKKRLEHFPSTEARALNLSLKLGLPVGKLYKMIRP